MYLQLGDDSLAEQNALEATRLNPNMARAQGRLGEAYFRQNNYADAVEALEFETEYVEGMQFDRGYISAYFITDADTMEAVIEAVSYTHLDVYKRQQLLRHGQHSRRPAQLRGRAGR